MKASDLGLLLGISALAAAAWIVSSSSKKSSTNPISQLSLTAPSFDETFVGSQGQTPAQAQAWSSAHPGTLVTWAQMPSSGGWGSVIYYANGKSFGEDYVDALHTAQYGTPYW